jgi:hypothetical protein
MTKYIYWWETEGLRNFGDLVEPYIVRELTKDKIIKVKHPSMRRYKYFLTHYLTAGSIIAEANSSSIVWGSGIMYKNQNVRNAIFLAVRGPRTRKRLLELGYKCPNMFGDPALLLSNFYKPITSKQYKFGVIPHYMDFEFVSKNFENNKEVKIINLIEGSVEDVIDQVNSCENIFSSSLHGIIVSHTYNIPALWVKFGKRLGGDDVKFYDYLESVGIGDFSPDVCSKDISETTLEIMSRNKHKFSLPAASELEMRKQELLKSCPFNKSFSSFLLLEARVKFNFLKNVIS